jgi:hypothetical protein
MQEAEVVRDALVQQPERMRQVHLAEAPVRLAVEQAVARGRALAAPVHRHHRAVVVRRREKRARLVREMVLDEVPAERPVVPDAAKAPLQMVRRAARELARRVHDRRQEQRMPRRRAVGARRMGGRLQRQRQFGLGP